MPSRKEADMTEFPATVHHVGLTVTDLEVSRQWYQQLLNTAPVLDEEVPAVPDHHQGFRKVAFVLPGGLVLGLVVSRVRIPETGETWPRLACR
jgi:catechol 2,3-dioxygenase-like lactoylglutathione lyase family enzyme